GGDERHWLEWQDDATRLRAIDLTRFYGFYCLVFEEKATVNRLAELRVNHPTKNTGGHALVNAIVNDNTDHAADDNADIADRLTGHIRHRTDAAEGGAAAGGNGATPTKNTGHTGTATGTGTT